MCEIHILAGVNVDPMGSAFSINGLLWNNVLSIGSIFFHYYFFQAPLNETITLVDHFLRLQWTMYDEKSSLSENGILMFPFLITGSGKQFPSPLDMAGLGHISSNFVQ